MWQTTVNIEIKKLKTISTPSNPTLCVGIWNPPQASELAKRKLSCGILNLYAPSDTYAAFCINENCDETVRHDMMEALRRIGLRYVTGKEEGLHDKLNRFILDNLCGRSLSIPVSQDRMALGTWQGVYVFFDRYFVQEQLNGIIKINVTLLEAADYSLTNYNANYRGSHRIASSKLDGIPPRASLAGDRGDPANEVRTMEFGQLSLYHTHHTSASLCLGEGDCCDLEKMIDVVVPDTWNDDFFKHIYEGRDDMTGHMKSTLLGCHAFLMPSLNPSGQPTTSASGPSQLQVYLNEHRDCGGWGSGHTRKISNATLLYEIIGSKGAGESKRELSVDAGEGGTTPGLPLVRKETVVIGSKPPPSPPKKKKGEQSFQITSVTAEVRQALSDIMLSMKGNAALESGLCFLQCSDDDPKEASACARVFVGDAIMMETNCFNRMPREMLPCNCILPPAEILDSNSNLRILVSSRQYTPFHIHVLQFFSKNAMNKL